MDYIHCIVIMDPMEHKAYTWEDIREEGPIPRAVLKTMPKSTTFRDPEELAQNIEKARGVIWFRTDELSEFLNWFEKIVIHREFDPSEFTEEEAASSTADEQLRCPPRPESAELTKKHAEEWAAKAQNVWVCPHCSGYGVVCTTVMTWKKGETPGVFITTLEKTWRHCPVCSGKGYLGPYRSGY